MMAATKTLRVTQTKGLMGRNEVQRATVRGLGLKWRNHTVEVKDTPENRGMLRKISYMVKVTEEQA